MVIMGSAKRTIKNTFNNKEYIMKLWRKLAMEQGKKNGSHPGRSIKQGMQLEEYVFRNSTKTYPLLTAIFANAGLVPQVKQEKQEVVTNEAV
jgi:hypothetical protein